MIRFKPYSLLLREPFGTAHGVRDRTDGMLVAVSDDHFTGFGEVFMPPYYPENQESMAAFFPSVDIDMILTETELISALEIVRSIGDGNLGAKAALDIALFDLWGKRSNQPLTDLIGNMFPSLESTTVPETSFTIGFDEIEVMVRKASEATDFNTLKIKLNGTDDVRIIEAIRRETDKRLYVDANQGWKDPVKALQVAGEIIDLGVELIEQPFPVGELDNVSVLRDAIDVPVIADEDVQTVGQLESLAKHYDGINIKLMKTGGILPASEMILAARRFGLKILLGCMTESSIGISAAAALAVYADWCDLDGNLLITNDTCTGTETIDGHLINAGTPGIGIVNDGMLREFFGI